MVAIVVTSSIYNTQRPVFADTHLVGGVIKLRQQNPAPVSTV